MKVGDIVKSLDFAHVSDCYMIGKVISISKIDGTFRAECIKKVWQGKIDRKFPTDTFVAPLQGNHLLDDVTPGRVTVIG